MKNKVTAVFTAVVLVVSVGWSALSSTAAASPPQADPPQSRMSQVRLAEAASTQASSRQAMAVPAATSSTSAAEPVATQHSMGAKLPTKLVAPQIVPKATAPASADLRQYAVPVGDQDPLGSCTAWAVAYAMMGWYAQRDGMNARAFAPMYMYSQINGGVDAGSLSTDAFDLAVSQGIDTQDDYMPQGNYDYLTQPTDAQRANAANSKFTGYDTLFANDTGVGPVSRTLIEDAISSGQPVAVSFAARAGFFNMNAQSDLSVPDDDYTTDIIGYHEVLALAYDEDGLIIQNSWGSDWAAGGYTKLSWNVVAADVFEADVATGYVAQPSVPVVSVTVPQWEVSAFGASTSLQVPSNTAWAVTAPSWITVTPSSGFGLVTAGPTGGRGNVPVSLTAAPNTTTSQRTGTVTFTSTVGSPQAVATVDVLQHDTGYDDCGASLTDHCDWPDLSTEVMAEMNAPNDSDWFAFSPSVSGIWTLLGSVPRVVGAVLPDYVRGTVLAADGTTVLATNENDDINSALYFTLHVSLQAGTTYFLEAKNAGGNSGLYSLSALPPTLQPSLDLPNLGWWIFTDDAQSVGDSVLSNTTWAATTDVPWLRVVPTSGVGTWPVGIIMDANPSGVPRTGTITYTTTTGTPVITLTEWVQQSVRPTISVDRSSWSVPSAGAESITAQVTSNYYWSITSDASWLSVSPSSGVVNAPVTISADANTTGAPRTATLTFATEPWIPRQATWTVTVTQPGEVLPPPTLSLSENAWSLDSADPATELVQVSSNTSWSASSDMPWITVAPSDGVGDAMVQVTVDGNSSAVARHGTVTFTTPPGVGGLSATATLSVSQSGMSILPSITVDPSTWQVPSDASADTFVAVTASTSWTASSSDPWLTVSPASGAGDESVMLTVSENTGAERSGVVTFSTTGPEVVSATVMVTQPAGAPAPSLEVSDTSWVVASSSADTDRVQVSSNTSWSVTSDQPWLTVSPDSGTGDGTLTLSATANTGSSPRMGVVTVTTTSGSPAVSRTVSVTQPGASGGSTLTVGLSAWSVPSAVASMVSTMVSSSTSWSVSSDATWLTVSPSSGTGSQAVMITAGTNPGTAPRAATLTFTTTSGSPLVSVRVPVTQPGPQADTDLTVNLSSWTVPRSSAVSATAWVTTTMAWTASSSDPWLTVSPASGTGSKQVTMSAAANPGGDRMGVLTFTSTTDPLATARVLVTQPGDGLPPGPSLLLSATSWSLGSSLPETDSVQVTSNVSWSASSNQAWLTVSPSAGTGNGTVTLSATENTTSSPRMGLVTVTTTSGSPAVSRTIAVTQPGASSGPTLTVGMSTWSVPSAAASMVSTSVSSNTSWSASSDQAWLTVSPSSGTGNQSVAFTAAANPGATSRTATLTFTTTSGTPAVTVTVSVTQPGTSGGSTLSVGMSAWSVPSAVASLVSTMVYSSTSWSVTSDQSWVTVLPNAGTGNQAVSITAGTNPGTAPRTATLTFTTTSGSPVTTVTVQVTQPGPQADTDLTVNLSSWTVPRSTAVSATAWVTTTMAWTASSSDPWLTVSPASGTGSKQVTMSAAANTTGGPRTGTLTFTSTTNPLATATVIVTQP
ncbi:MAG: hypothetical protein FWD75_00695 [Propionibacteriaceae bacterium]|nr:hypothetical protein [Propionibacteriaceae bacterium]